MNSTAGNEVADRTAATPHPGGRARRRTVRRMLDEWRPSAVTLGAPALPLAILFGLNAVDELDRSAFAVLLPDIRAHFALSDAAVLGLVGATTIAIVLIELPLSFYADRGTVYGSPRRARPCGPCSRLGRACPRRWRCSSRRASGPAGARRS